MDTQMENNVSPVNNEPKKKCFGGCEGCSGLTDCKCARIGILVVVVLVAAGFLVFKYLV